MSEGPPAARALHPSSAPLDLLPAAKRDAIAAIVAALREIPAVVALALGGSRARGTARADSDVDLGLYYDEEAPFRIADIRAVAARFHGQGAPVVTELYEWGPWVNGGAWLETSAGRVDFLYRNIAHVERVLSAAERGEVEWHFGQQPPYGFRSVIYLAETSDCVPLFDRRGVLARLKERVSTYPEALRVAIVRGSLWGAEFTLMHARKFAAEGDVYATAGCLTRIACELVQVLFALNRAYFTGDKGAAPATAAFSIAPADFDDRLRAILAAPGANAKGLSSAVESSAGLIASVVELAAGIYQPKYRLPT